MVRRAISTPSAVGMAPHAGPSLPPKPPLPPSYLLEFRFSLATLPPGKIKFPISNGVCRGEEEIRMIPDPVGPQFDRFAVRPTIKTAPVIDRLQPVTDVMKK